MAFTMLETWHKTPADFGVDWRDVDPLYTEAMLIIKEGFVHGRNAEAPPTMRPH